jgi:hypothetical protein
MAAIMNLSKRIARTAVMVASAIATLAVAPAALAVPVGTTYSYALSVSQPASGLPATSYGTVTLTQGLNEVDVNVTLASGFLFANTGVGGQFAFNLDQAFSNATITLDAATAANFVLGPLNSYNMTPYGVFTDALLFKSSIGNGLSGQIGTPLNFSVAQTGISLDAFSTSTERNNGQPGGYNFAADLGLAATGKTGGVGSGSQVTITPPKDVPAPPAGNPVPEPMTLTLLGLGLGGIALSRRRK